MSYTFQAPALTLEGRTIPGNGYMRIHIKPDNTFFVGFIPIPDTQTAQIKSGIWNEIGANTDLSLLKEIQPQVITACERRLARFRQVKKRHGETIMTGIPEPGFDDNYFMPL